MTYTIVIGDKAASSWSMRPWLVLDHFGFEYEEVVVQLDQPETRPTILTYSPAGKVPVLIDRSFAVWDSLAIIEYLAETRPDAAIWPEAPQERALARALAAEMHSGYAALRASCPMNLTASRTLRRRGGAPAQREVDRFEAMVRDRAMRSEGTFLFGEWCAVDAMYAPLTSRLTTYGWPMEEATRRYVDAVQGERSYRRWLEAAREGASHGAAHAA
ncbi:glutathione S-transferase N-terminal domain-containing protein [Acuticoccus sp.]|uniref:glutathione S-transferase N-terminal domain-containing protein n=1 Tax=Acuticoccus sp. TaxID=1904378 RepID=UPI003B52F5A4